MQLTAVQKVCWVIGRVHPAAPRTTLHRSPPLLRALLAVSSRGSLASPVTSLAATGSPLLATILPPLLCMRILFSPSALCASPLASLRGLFGGSNRTWRAWSLSHHYLALRGHAVSR